MVQRNYLLFLFLLCVFLCALRTVVGGGSLVASKTPISFWNGWTGPDGTAMLQVIRRFNEQNPDVDVSMQRMDWATYYNKLIVSSKDQRGPQVFIVHAATLPRMLRAGFISDVSDLYGPKTGILDSDFEPKVLTMVEDKGRRIALPLDIHPQGMYCNSEMLLAAGWKNSDGTPRPPKNREEFLRALKDIQKTKPDGSVDPWGFTESNWLNNFETLIPQFGGRYVDDRGNPDLANPHNIAALHFMQDLMVKYKFAPPLETNGWIGFRQKHVAMVWDGVYMIGDLRSVTGLNYVGAPIPQIGPYPGTKADSHCFCIRTGLSAKERDACERFIVFLSNNSLEWAKAGQVPARKSIRNLPDFKKDCPAQYQFSLQIPGMMYPPRTPILFELELELGLAVEKVLRGHGTPEEALKLANDNVTKAMQRDREDNPS